MNGIFVTGTDTDIGKTIVSSLVANALSPQIHTTYYKPVQAGRPTDLDWVKGLGHENLNFKESTYLFENPMSPDRAADKENVLIDLNQLARDWQGRRKSFYVVEGAGGLEVPLNKDLNMIDLIKEFQLPALLVASTRLGTINHTLLSIKALQNKGISCLGIALTGEKDEGLKELLEEKSGVPVVFEVPWLNQLTSERLNDYASDHIDFKNFIQGCVGRVRDFGENQSGELESLSNKDKQFVWHPFTQHGIVKKHPLVTRAQGAYLWLDHHKVLDAISSWWVNLFGHCHPELSLAVSQQTRQLEHVIFAGFTHKPAIELSEKLVGLTNERQCELSKVFFSDNGSTSVEVALKMAWQYCQQLGDTKRQRFLALKGSYHGDTLGAMSASEREGFNQVFNPLMFDVDFVDPFDISDLEEHFHRNGSSYAAVIVEPLVQGASGMRMYSPEFLDRLSELAKEFCVLIICDEIFTGFYRTGTLFAFEQTKLRPDLLCLSKGLTGGYLPLSVTMATETLYQAFENDSMKRAFLHGHSYTANPLACQVACKTLELLERPETLSNIGMIREQTSHWLNRLRDNPKIFNVRQLGTIGAMEIMAEDANYFKGDMSYRFNQRAVSKGVLLRPLGGTVYSVPPYCVEPSEIEKIYSTINEIVNEEF